MNQVHSMLPGFTPGREWQPPFWATPQSQGSHGIGLSTSSNLVMGSRLVCLRIAQPCVFTGPGAPWLSGCHHLGTLSLTCAVSEPHSASVMSSFFLSSLASTSWPKSQFIPFLASNYPFLQTRSLTCLQVLYFPNQNSPVMFVCPLKSTK